MPATDRLRGRRLDGMTAIIDGITVMGTPEEINRLIEMRQKPKSNCAERIVSPENFPNYTVSCVNLSN